LSVPAEVSLQVVQAELAVAVAYAAAVNVVVDGSSLSADTLRFYALFRNRDGEQFLAEFYCLEYPLHPPTIEFVSVDCNRRGDKNLYPQGFHPTPCVCTRYNRKAYGALGGPHGDWRLLDWRLPTSNGVGIDSLALMISDLDSKIRVSSGRMA
jgi:hypothetical protein